MKFKCGDVVEHRLSGQKIMILYGRENVFMAGATILSTIYEARIPERPDLIYYFDEIELKEVNEGGA
jgi:hypothetical protein